MLKFGVVFPTEFSNDPLLTRDFVQTVESLGYDYILTYEQIVNVSSDSAPTVWHEPYMLMSYLSALTSQLGFTTGISVLPSRQTILVAKQIAQLDRYCGGRLRLGVSTGWNEAEYLAGGIDFASRGKRLDEQIQLLRKLWVEDYVTFEGDYHRLENVGIFPKPEQQPIPVWIGGYADVVLRRVATLGDGWLADASAETSQSIMPKLDTIRRYAERVDRNPEDIGLEVVDVHLEEKYDWGQWVRNWEEIGAGYMSVTTRHAGFSTPQQHIDLFTEFIQAVR